MNVFADWLFTILLGWTGIFANSVWNAVVNSAGGISDFFARFWLPLVIGLIVGGTVLDYMVWFIRWRPYLVWRSWLSRRRQRRQMKQARQSLDSSGMDQGTLNTIADWVATPQETYPVYDLSEPQSAPQDAEGFPPQEAGYFTQASFADAYAPSADRQGLYQFLRQDEQGMEAFTPARSDAQVGGMSEASPSLSTADDRLFTSAQPPAIEYNDWAQHQGRRRRSERSRQRTMVQKLSDLRERFSPGDDGEGMLDGLPAPVNQQDAYHEAFYPQRYPYQPVRQEQQPPAGKP